MRVETEQELSDSGKRRKVGKNFDRKNSIISQSEFK